MVARRSTTQQNGPQCGTTQHNAAQWSVTQHNAAPCSTVAAQCSTMQRSAAQQRAMQQNAAQCGTTQDNAAERSPVQHNAAHAIQRSTTQHKAAQRLNAGEPIHSAPDPTLVIPHTCVTLLCSCHRRTWSFSEASPYTVHQSWYMALSLPSAQPPPCTQSGTCHKWIHMTQVDTHYHKWVRMSTGLCEQCAW